MFLNISSPPNKDRSELTNPKIAALEGFLWDRVQKAMGKYKENILISTVYICGKGNLLKVLHLTVQDLHLSKRHISLLHLEDSIYQ